MSHDVTLSREGYEKLKKELELLKGPERQRVADNIREAKSHGDLRENAMYHEAKLNQRRLESRIAELEHVLQNPNIVEDEREEGVAGLGSKIKLLDMEWADEMTIELVGDFEADPMMDKISISSPMGAACLNRRTGEEIDVETPGGMRKFKILHVE